MRFSSSVAALGVAALVLFSGPARADEDDAALALAAGAGVTFASLGVGGIMVARGNNHLVKNVGFIGAQGAMVPAPLLAHAIVGEPVRGIWFSLPLVLPAAVTGTFAALYPSLIRRAPAGVQYAAAISLLVSTFGSAIGIVDAVMIGSRKPKKDSTASSSFTLVPLVGNGVGGALLSGSL